MSVDHQVIYENRARDYDSLVSAEDCDGNLGPAIASIVGLEGALALEVGSGTGRITRLLARAGADVVAVERASDMVAQAATRSPHSEEQRRGLLLRADARDLPITAGWADLAVAGWVLGHFRSWYEDHWERAIEGAIDEMTGAVKTGGAAILIETLGTGSASPAPPTPELAEYYEWLEKSQGFSKKWIRTDYQFESVDDAAQRCGFFFGADLERRVRRESWSRVPECTGIWWRRVDP